MTQKWSESGVVPVTAILAGPCTITQIKGEKDGYQAIQVGFYETKKKVTKSIAGHLKGLAHFRTLREFRMTTDAKRGQLATVAAFKVGDMVQVIGIAKGKGFQGVVKRHHFGGSPKTHGHKDQHRMPGSIGATEPKHVFKGTRMGGRMGGQQVTIKNLEIIEIDEKNNLLYVKGAVPGARNGLLAISGEGDMTFVDAIAADAPSAEVVVEAEVAATPEVSEAAPVADEVVAEAPAVEEKKEETKSEETPISETK